MSGRTHATRRGPFDPEADELAAAAETPAPDHGVLARQSDGAAENLTRGQVLVLQRSVGNAAVKALLAPKGPAIQREGGTATETPEAEAEPMAEGVNAEPELAPETMKDTPEHPPPPKLKLDLASGEAVLTGAFGKNKKIVPGKIEVLDPAAFQAAYDKIYGATQWSWDKYVKPTYGSLNGFADKGVNYINKGSAGLHTVVHEMLHNNTDVAGFRDFVGSRFDEGATEVLTQEACAKVSEPAPVCYPGESPVVRELLKAGLPLDDLITAYFSGGAAFKIAAWINSNCKSNWATFKMHMEAKDWAAAKADLAKKA
jgi:hypothetical protein